MTERKATEVLLAIEKTAQTVLGYVRSIDTNIKLLINNQNIRPTQEAYKTDGLGKPTEPSQPSLTAQAVDFPQVAPEGFTGRPRTVQEKLFYKGTDKIILLAQVEIFDSNGSLVKKLRTNNQGAWTTKLEPGDYRIRVAKNKTKDKAGLAVNYEITVLPGDGPQTLESRKL